MLEVFTSMMAMLTTLVALVVARGSVSPVWQGGGVTLYPNGTYTASFGVGGSGKVALTNGWYGLRCGGVPMALVPTSVSALPQSFQPPLPQVTATLGGSSSARVTLVAIGSGCNGTRMEATITHFPSVGSVVFTQSFPDGVAHTFTGPPPGTPVAYRKWPVRGDVYTGDGEGHTDSVSVDESVEFVGGDEVSSTCTLKNNTDYHGHDIRFISNVTDVGVCCAACVAEPSCVAFSLMGAADKGTAWADRCYLKYAAPQAMHFNTHVSGEVPGRSPSPAPPGPSPPPPGTLPSTLATAFPLWDGPESAGFLTWSGEFFPAKWGNDVKDAPLNGAPYVLFDPSVPHGDGAVVSTFDEHFTSGCYLSGDSCGCGVLTAVESLVPGYSCSAFLSPGGGGVTNITMSWGATFQRAHNTSRDSVARDIVTTKLGYWTDNAAFYDWYHWFPHVNRDGRPQDVLLEIDAELTSKNLTAHYYQLDAYWYKLEIAPACCIVDWTAVSDQFPNGLEWLSTKLGDKPMLLYTDIFCNDTTYRKENGGNWTFMNADKVSISWFTGYVANVVPEESAEFYTKLMQHGLSQGMGGFEVDFLDFNFNLYPRFRSEPGTHAMWLAGIDTAATAFGIGVQYCMTLPQHMLNSASLRSVTSTRVSGDGGRPYTNGGPGSLLAAALGVRPFKDNAWTSGSYPKGIADIVGSVLTMGPVGLADQLNATIGTIAATSCSRDGTLLHPNRPATPIDSTFVGELGGGSVLAAHYGPRNDSTGDSRAYVIAVTGASATIGAADLWPAPVQGVQMMMWRWNDTATGGHCTAGADAATCLSALPTGGSIKVVGDSNDVTVFHLSPVLPGGWVVLGETSKVIPVSFARVVSVTSSDALVSVDVVGAPNEMVIMSFARVGKDGVPTGAIITASTTLPTSGHGTISAPSSRT